MSTIALRLDFRDSRYCNGFRLQRCNHSGLGAMVLILVLLACVGLTNCAGIVSSPNPLPGTGSLPSITSFTADPASMNAGANSMLSWETSRATTISISPGGFTSTSASGSTSVDPTVTTMYTLTATNAAGSTTATAAVTVTMPAKPTISSFTASPISISSGSSSMLGWATTGAASIAITPGTFTSTSASGSTSVDPTVTTMYTLTATNAAGSTTATATVTVTVAEKPTISSFTASPTSISSGSSSMLGWATTGAASIAITPGTFTSTSASGSTSVSPTATTTYTLTATNAAGSATATATVTVTTAGEPLTITTTSCPNGIQLTSYAGCMIRASGGTPPYTFSTDASQSYATLPEGMVLDASTGAISSSLVGGQGNYGVQFIVTDAENQQATQLIDFAVQGNNSYLPSIFPSSSIFHHRVDAATTSLPVDTSPAAPISSDYLSETIKAFFGNAAYRNISNGIPTIEVPCSRSHVSVTTISGGYQSYFTSGPIPPYAPIEGTATNVDPYNYIGDGHVLVYQEAGCGNPASLWELFEGEASGGGWLDKSNALWSNVGSNNLTPQGMGTADAAGLPIAPLLVNADEVIGTGTPISPNGTVQHPIRFTLNHMLNYWVWPATETAGVGSCTATGGSSIAVESLISQSSPPASCTWSAPAGEIYRLMASVPNPTCASTSPQSAIIITAMRNYGIILADNGSSGGLIGTPDTRWNDTDLQCLKSLTLSDFEPVNVSSLMVSTDSGATSH